MSLKLYTIYGRDNFEPGNFNSATFPCSACRFIVVLPTHEPCNTCDHNMTAEPEDKADE